jgi:thiol-disulfide isomerase/thioredoxin
MFGSKGLVKKFGPSFTAYATAVGASVALAAYVITSRFAEGLKRTLRVKTNVKKLKGILNRYGGNPKVLLLFVAGDDETGKSWCPDCRLAVPVVYSIVDKKGYTVIECDVGDRPTWKDLDHELRKSEKFKLTGVPCLMKVGRDGAPTSRLDEELETCKCTKDVELFVKAFLNE